MDDDRPPADLSAEALHHLLMYGSESSRHRLAWSIARMEEGLPAQLGLIAETIRSDASPLLRSRCVELLKMTADKLWSESIEVS